MDAAAADPATPDWAVALFAGLAFLIVFPTFWCLVIWLLGGVSGWRRLAKAYPAADRPVVGEGHFGVSGNVGVVNFRGTLELHLTEEGFFLQPNALFRFGQKRLFIPWEAVTERRPRRILWLSMERLTIGEPKVGTITLPQRVLERWGTR